MRRLSRPLRCPYRGCRQRGCPYRVPVSGVPVPAVLVLLTFAPFNLPAGRRICPGGPRPLRQPGLTQGLGAADYFHDLGGDRVLTGTVHLAAQGLDQVVCVVRGRLHGSLLGHVKRCGRFKQGQVHLGLEPSRQQAVQYLVGFGLELEDSSSRSPSCARAARDGTRRRRRSTRWEPSAQKVGVDKVNLADVAVFELVRDRLPRPAGRPRNGAGQ